MIISKLLFKKDFRFWIGLSIAGHVILFLIITFSNFKTSKPVMVQQSVKIDMIGLPDIKRKAIKKKRVKKKKARSIPKKKVAKRKPKKKIKKKDIKTAQASAIEKLKRDTAQKNPSHRGEKISKGNSSEGQISEVLLNAYFNRVKVHVIQYWNLPQWLADKNLRATVIIQVNSFGDITRIELEKTSGNETFDQVVIDTIKMSSPLPEPLPELTSTLKQGVGFHFPE